MLCQFLCGDQNYSLSPARIYEIDQTLMTTLGQDLLTTGMLALIKTRICQIGLHADDHVWTSPLDDCYVRCDRLAREYVKLDQTLMTKS